MQIIEGEGFYRLVPLHTAGDVTLDQGKQLLFGTDEQVLAYFDAHPMLIGYELTKISPCEVIS